MMTILVFIPTGDNVINMEFTNSSFTFLMHNLLNLNCFLFAFNVIILYAKYKCCGLS